MKPLVFASYSHLFYEIIIVVNRRYKKYDGHSLWQLVLMKIQSPAALNSMLSKDNLAPDDIVKLNGALSHLIQR